METFVPEKPTQYIVVKIKRDEADLIQKLRRYPFGEFIVHKANNVLFRIEIKDSQKIEPDAQIDLG
jgi:hypothetical protein